MSKKKKGSLLRNSHGYIIPSQEMLFKVDQMIRKLDKLSTPQSILHGNPEIPGIVLERSMVSPLDRKGKEYKKILKEYEKKRPEFLAALANHPVGKSLSLLAVGKEGVEMMRKGKVPKLNLGTIVDDDGIRRNAIAFYNVRRLKPPGQSQKNSRDCYNCHHIIQKSVKAKHLRSPNDPENLVLVQSFRTHNNQFNPHHFWHALFLHPQINGNPGVVQPYYAPRPLFPVYPPVQKPIHSIEQLREELKKLDPQATLPHSWENKIIAFSRLLGNQPYRVPARYREAIKLYQRIYSKENKEEIHAVEARNTAAQEAGPLAKEWLPPGAVVNGQPLPLNHKPKFILPIVDRANRIQKESFNSFPPIAPKKNKQRKNSYFIAKQRFL